MNYRLWRQAQDIHQMGFQHWDEKWIHVPILNCQWPSQRSCSQQQSLWTAIHQIVKLWLVNSGEAKPWEDCFQNSPCFCCASSCLMLSHVCCIWHGNPFHFNVKGSVSKYSVIISWENPTLHWAIYMQIILKMIFIEQQHLEMWDLLRMENNKFQALRTCEFCLWKKTGWDQKRQLCPCTQG